MSLATLRASRRTGHGVVTITRAERTRRYRVSLSRLYWLRFWLIICCPWRTGGAWLNGGVDVSILLDEPRDDTPEWRRRQWQDFRRRNWKRLPRCTVLELQRQLADPVKPPGP